MYGDKATNLHQAFLAHLQLQPIPALRIQRIVIVVLLVIRRIEGALRNGQEVGQPHEHRIARADVHVHLQAIAFMIVETILICNKK